MLMWPGLCLPIQTEAQTGVVSFVVKAVTIKELKDSGGTFSKGVPIFITTSFHTWKKKGFLILQIMCICFL